MASSISHSPSHQGLAPKPNLTVAQVFTMSFGFLGIQFGFALQNANTSRILRTFGADVDQLPMFWIVAPLVGMIIQPLVGHYSDRTWNRLGRRKPYFLAGALLSSTALTLLPNAGLLASVGSLVLIGVCFLAIMDACINLAMEPFRALVADNLPDSQRTLGFSIQTFLIGTGAIIGSILPYALHNWFGISNVAPEGSVAPNTKIAFYIGAAVFFCSILWTIISTKEYPPAEYEKYH